MLNSILIHWRALCILYGSLLASIAFAVGHHFYYRNLNNKPVSTANDLASWAGVSSQKFNTAVGNTFASLFRTFLTITVTTSYLQILWRALKSEGTNLKVVDAISGVLTNPIGLMNRGAWKKSGMLLLLAITIWLLPIAPVITPATLTVETIAQISQGMVNVSSIDFNSLNFASVEHSFHPQCGFGYDGPQFEVQKIAASATGQGAILPIDLPGNHPNVSYTQQFAGPALQCSDVQNPFRGEILSNVNTSSWNVTQIFGYLAWVPSAYSSLPFDFLDGGPDDPARWRFHPDLLGPPAPNGGLASGGPLTLFVATFPNFSNPYPTRQPDFDFTANATIVECRLVNATYSSSFSWTNGIRDLAVTVASSNNSIVYPNWIDCRTFLFTNGIDTNNTEDIPQQPLSDYNNTIIQQYAYASVMQSFVSVLQGTIYYHFDDERLQTTTQAMNTALGATQELFALRNSTKSQMLTLDSDGPQLWPGISVKMHEHSTLDLHSTLELMFQNVTMSLMNSPLLQPDPATPYYPPAVDVTTITYHNQYAYSAEILWLAYGTAILIATIIVILGCLAIFSSGLSYSSSFSTILRTTSHASISTKISRQDAVGQDPLPKHLAEATITFSHADVNEEEAVKEHLVAKGDHELQSVSSRSERYATW